jgi:hypothetical protein
VMRFVLGADAAEYERRLERLIHFFSLSRRESSAERLCSGSGSENVSRGPHWCLALAGRRARLS